MERRTPLQRVQGVLHKYPYLSPLIVLVLCIVVFYALNDRFLLPQNISFVTQQTVVVGTLAIAQTLVILTAGIDLSIGAATTLAQMMMANLAVFATASNVLPFAGQNPYLAIAAGIGVGVLTGVINGLLIVRLNLPPFIVTLGTLSIFTALTLIVFKARTIQNKEMPDEMKWLGNTFQIGEFQLLYGVVIMIIMYVVFGYILKNTAWGLHVYAVGDDPNAAELLRHLDEARHLQRLRRLGPHHWHRRLADDRPRRLREPQPRPSAQPRHHHGGRHRRNVPVRRPRHTARHPDRCVDHHGGPERPLLGRPRPGLPRSRGRHPRHRRRRNRPVDQEGEGMTATTTVTPVVQGVNLVKTFGRVVALDGTNLEACSPGRCSPWSATTARASPA